MYILNGFGADDYIVHTVASGETLAKIAKKYGTTYQAIAKTNMIDDPNKLEVGQQLMVYATGPKPKAITASLLIPKLSLPPMSNAMINYALIGGIVALGIPIAIKIMKNRQATR